MLTIFSDLTYSEWLYVFSNSFAVIGLIVTSVSGIKSSNQTIIDQVYNTKPVFNYILNQNKKCAVRIPYNFIKNTIQEKCNFIIGLAFTAIGLTISVLFNTTRPLNDFFLELILVSVLSLSLFKLMSHIFCTCKTNIIIQKLKTGELNPDYSLTLSVKNTPNEVSPEELVIGQPSQKGRNNLKNICIRFINLVKTKDKILKYILIAILIIIVFPLLVTYGVSFRIINTDTSNEWIGFWGGYMGAIIGGLVTLYVMRETNKEATANLNKTFKIENKRINDEKKKLFNDEILNMSLEFYIKMSSLLADLNRGKASECFVADTEKILLLSKKLLIKLATKKDCEEYEYCNELSDSILNATRSFKKTLSLTNNKDTLNALKDSIKNTDTTLEKLNEDISKHYFINESL